MPWTWVRPADERLLDGRPLLDLGTGDGQTLAAVVRGPGPVIGLDRSVQALRAARRSTQTALVAGDAERLPIAEGRISVVVAADLFHHLDDGTLERVLREVRRVLRPGGHLLAWWYRDRPHPAPDAPQHPRAGSRVGETALRSGFTRSEPLRLVLATDAGPATVGIHASS
jgi:ubiquinone/menaquinone biosynthesis C-methylase UbiE